MAPKTKATPDDCPLVDEKGEIMGPNPLWERTATFLAGLVITGIIGSFWIGPTIRTEVEAVVAPMQKDIESAKVRGDENRIEIREIAAESRRQVERLDGKIESVVEVLSRVDKNVAEIKAGRDEEK